MKNRIDMSKKAEQYALQERIVTAARATVSDLRKIQKTTFKLQNIPDDFRYLSYMSKNGKINYQKMSEKLRKEAFGIIINPQNNKRFSQDCLYIISPHRVCLVGKHNEK